MSSLSTHALDTARGCPAVALPLALSRQQGDDWIALFEGQTNGDGRVPALGDLGTLVPAVYRLRFDTAHYFTSRSQQGLYPWVDIVFALPDDSDHYHVPLLLAPYGYSTYRGS